MFIIIYHYEENVIQLEPCKDVVLKVISDVMAHLSYDKYINFIIAMQRKENELSIHVYHKQLLWKTMSESFITVRTM